MLIYRICLVLSCVGLTILAGAFIPGPKDTWHISRRIALGAAQIGSLTIQANTILTILTTLQAILVVLCTSVLIHHLARIWLYLDHTKDDKSGMTAASLDAVFMNYLQMFKRLWHGLDQKDLVIFVISASGLLLAQGSHTVFQLFLMNGSLQSPLEASVFAVNTTHIIPDLVQSYMYYPLLSVQATMPGSMALMSGLLDVLGACNTTTQSCFLERETAPLIKCEKNTSECWNQIDVFSDFNMTCTSGVLFFGEALSAREIKSLASTTTASTFIFWNGAGIKY